MQILREFFTYLFSLPSFMNGNHLHSCSKSLCSFLFQKMQETLILPCRLREKDNQLTKSCESIYIELCGTTKFQPKRKDGCCANCKLQKGHRHVCNVCGKCWRLPSDLVRHFRTHTGERPFECEVCGQSFVQPSAMYHHQRSLHGMNGPGGKGGKGSFKKA